MTVVGSDPDFQRALVALRSGNLDDAEGLFKATLHATPQHVAALNLLTTVLMQRGRFAEAEPYLRRALALAWNDSTLHNYGLALNALGRWTEALERLTQALHINPDVVETRFARADVHLHLRNYAAAIVDYDAVLRLKPGASHYVASMRLLAKLAIADWTNLSAEIAAVTSSPRCDPFLLCLVSLSSAAQLQCARAYAAGRPTFAPLWRGEMYRHDRIRVGVSIIRFSRTCHSAIGCWSI